MHFFKSVQERQYWMYAFVVLLVIMTSLLFSEPILHLFGNQNMQALVFVSGMILIAAMIFLYAFSESKSLITVILAFGFGAVFLMLFLRLNLPERSHLMEYSVLAIFVHLALIERIRPAKNSSLSVAYIAFVITFLISLTDECLQIFIPERIFDFYDILFNGFVIFVAIATRLLLQYFRNRKRRLH